jgi:hypothetical protein
MFLVKTLKFFLVHIQTLKLKKLLHSSHMCNYCYCLNYDIHCSLVFNLELLTFDHNIFSCSSDLVNFDMQYFEGRSSLHDEW